MEKRTPNDTILVTGAGGLLGGDGFGGRRPRRLRLHRGRRGFSDHGCMFEQHLPVGVKAELEMPARVLAEMFNRAQGITAAHVALVGKLQSHRLPRPATLPRENDRHNPYRQRADNQHEDEPSP